MTLDPDRPCPHHQVAASVVLGRLLDGDALVGYRAEIRAWCAACDETFRWTGLAPGSSQARPTCSTDETTMYAPLRPASADPDFGLGYAVRFVEDGAP